MTTLVATDLDATLLDDGGVLGAEAREALAALRERGIPVIPLTSKTEEELAGFLAEMGCGSYGAFENGAGITGPDGTEIASNALPMAELMRILRKTADRTALSLRPIQELDDGELKERTGLEGDEARRARAHAFDLPFLAPPGSGEALAASLADTPRVALVKGGTFWHLSGRHDKGTALERLLEKYGLEGPLLGLGDAPNDAPFLARCDRAALVPASSGVSSALRERFPRAFVASRPGGAGWREAVFTLLAEAEGGR